MYTASYLFTCNRHPSMTALLTVGVRQICSAKTLKDLVSFSYKIAAKKREKKKRHSEEFRKQTDYISIVFIHTESAHAGALVPVSLHLP